MTTTPTTTNADRERGAAMITAVLGLLIVTVLTVAVMAVVTGDLSLSRRAADQVAVRFAAESGAEVVYGALVTDTHLFKDDTYKSLLGYVGDDPDDQQWVTFQEGFVVPCPDPGAQREPCWHFDATVDNSTDPRVVSVDVTAAGFCNNDRCVTERVRQTLRKRGFLDHLVFTNREALDPSQHPSLDPSANCMAKTSLRVAEEQTAADANDGEGDPTWQGCRTPVYHKPFTGVLAGDQVEGDIFTNDDYIVVCGDGVPFDGDITVVQDATYPTPAQVFTSGVGDACTPTAITGTGNRASVLTPLAMPCNYREAGSCEPLDELARIADVAGTAYVGNTSIVINAPTGLEVTSSLVINGSSPVPLPDTGVIHVTGDATIQGTLAGRLTVAASGNITITGDLVYNELDVLNDTTWADGATSMLGLVSGESVLVAKLDTPGATRTVHAGILAVNGSFSTPQWHLYAPRGTLRLFGAVAAQWRGAVGRYDDLNGSLSSGYRKHWTQDRRFSSEQPPFFVQPAASGWARVDLATIPAT